MKVKRMGITEILRRNWLFNKIKSSESVSKQPTQLPTHRRTQLIILTEITHTGLKTHYVRGVWEKLPNAAIFCSKSQQHT